MRKKRVIPLHKRSLSMLRIMGEPLQAKLLSIFIVIYCQSLIASPNPAVLQLKSITNQYETDLFDYWPELGIFWGRPNIAQDKFIDHSIAATLAWQTKEDTYLEALKRLDVHALTHSHAYITYRILKETLENNVASRVCKDYLWSVNPSFDGWIAITTQIAENQPVDTPHNRALALKRWQSFGLFVAVEINNLKVGVKQGYTAPKAAVQAVLKQVLILLDANTEHSPYYDFARRDSNKLFKKQVAHLIETVINPALQTYADYLQNDYLPHARTEIGVASLPNGTACYLAKVKKETTLTIEPKAIYNFGIAHMLKLNQEVATLGQKQFGKTNMADIFQLAQTKPEYLFHSEQEILDYNMRALNRAKGKVPTWFGMTSIRALKIKPYPPFRAITGASGEYYPPSEDGARPGIYYINTYRPNTHSRANQEAILFHELIPGHHFQLSIGSTNKNREHLNQYFMISGFGEGWALYVERLADEMGLYSDDIARIGMLSNEALRTARLVVDPGIHIMHWSREKAITYLKQHSTLSEYIIEGEVDRYIMNPGQATAYMLGKREIDHLRKEAKLRLKNKFNIKDFHDHILKQGMIPLTLLNEQIQTWIAEKNA